MRENNREFARELAECVFHPDRCVRFAKRAGMTGLEEYFELL